MVDTSVLTAHKKENKMKPKTKREKELAGISYNNGYDTANRMAAATIDKLKQDLSKAKESKDRFEAETKLINALGQSFEALSRATNAIQRY